MKPHIKFKQGQYWLWGSLKSSKDSLPRFKTSSMISLRAYFGQVKCGKDK